MAGELMDVAGLLEDAQAQARADAAAAEDGAMNRDYALLGAKQKVIERAAQIGLNRAQMGLSADTNALIAALGGLPQVEGTSDYI